MDKKVFRQWLESVAEIKDRKPVKTANHSRFLKEVIVEIDAETGEEFEVEVEIRENPTLGFDIVKLKSQPKICELDCGKVVCGQVIERKVAMYPKKHWVTRCVSCGCYVSPDGKSIIKGSSAMQAAFAKHFRDKK